MGSLPASCALLCPVGPLQPPATPIWQQQGQQGDTSKGTREWTLVTRKLYLGGSSWATSRREEGVQVRDGSELSHCHPVGSACQAAPQARPHPLGRAGATRRSQLPLRSLIAYLSRILHAKFSPWSGYTLISVTYEGRGRIFQGKVIKVCDKALRNPNINSLKNNSNCVRNSSFRVFV